MTTLTNYPGIKYFDLVQPLIPNHQIFDNIKYLEIESEISLNKIESIFEENFLKDLIKELKKMPSILNYKDGVRQIIFNDRINFHLFNFDNEGKIDTNNLTLSNNQDSSSTIKKAAQIGIERMAKELGWKNEQHSIGINILRYNLPTQQSVNPLKWHNDDDTHHSLVILLEDPSNQDDGWSGGNFCFTAERKVADDLDSKISFSKLSKRDRELFMLRPDTPIWEIEPKANNGVLFSNLGTLHTITPMRAFSKTADFVQRTILTFFEAKPESERSFT